MAETREDLPVLPLGQQALAKLPLSLCPMQAGVRPSAPVPQLPSFLWGGQDLLLQECPPSAALPGAPTLPAAVGAQAGSNQVRPTTLWNSACSALRSGSCFPGGAATSPRLTSLAGGSLAGTLSLACSRHHLWLCSAPRLPAFSVWTSPALPPST